MLQYKINQSSKHKILVLVYAIININISNNSSQR